MVGLVSDKTYVIEGWYLEDTFTTKVTTDTVFNGSVSVYAKWSEKTEDGVLVKIGICINDQHKGDIYPEITDGISISELTKLVKTEATSIGLDLSSYNLGGVYNGWLTNEITDSITISKLGTTGYNGQTVPYICINFTS